jgi:diguanylate cyclase (GGDEF)-like protein
MKVLVAEDNPAFAVMLKSLLEGWGYEVVTAREENQACALLQAEDGPRLAILDWTTSGIDGVKLCRRVRSGQAAHYVYILLLTARTQSQDVVMGIQAGADDYVTKPFDPDELCARLWAGRRILDLQEQLIQTREALREQATRDGLTGLWNRMSILDNLDNEIARARREGSSVGVVMADLDHFKQVNDRFGHLAGDKVLRLGAELLQRNVRQYDAVGRYGGEEFLMVLPGCDLEGAIAQAERVRSAFQPEVFGLPDTATVTCSFGVAALDCAGPIDADRVLREADAALYHAKRMGRNRVEGYHPSQQELVAHTGMAS